MEMKNRDIFACNLVHRKQLPIIIQSLKEGCFQYIHCVYLFDIELLGRAQLLKLHHFVVSKWRNIERKICIYIYIFSKLHVLLLLLLLLVQIISSSLAYLQLHQTNYFISSPLISFTSFKAMSVLSKPYLPLPWPFVWLPSFLGFMLYFFPPHYSFLLTNCPKMYSQLYLLFVSFSTKS